MNFASDTTAPMHPAVLAALTAANEASAPSYGADDWTDKVRALLSDIFETPLAVTWVNSGTASNALALSLICPPTGATICHENAHINRDERGAPAFFSGGGILRALDGAHDKLTRQGVEKELAAQDRDFVHETPADALSLSQLNEAGVTYSLDEVSALCALAHAHGLKTHMDGARLGNALAFLGCTPAQVTWQAGIDILSLGLTKTGAGGAEAIILFGDEAARLNDLEARRKRAGHMPPKQRFVSAQALALLETGLWLDLARHANAMAQELASVFTTCGGTLDHPVEGNEVFVRLQKPQYETLRAGGAQFYIWPDGSARFVTNWATPPDEIKAVRSLLS